MKVEYSNHAKKRMSERGINKKNVTEAIEFSEYTIKRGEEIEAYKKINEKMLKVVYINKIKYIKVITVYYL